MQRKARKATPADRADKAEHKERGAPPRAPRIGLAARIRNYFLTGLVIVGPVTITIYIVWWAINVVDAWVKPLVPRIYDPATYLPFSIPGYGLLFGFVGLVFVGALAANLLGRTLISYAEVMLARMPIVRNVYRALKQIFESVVMAAEANRMAGAGAGTQKVGLMEFPAKGIWSIVYVTGEASGAIKDARPAGETDLVAVFMPTSFMPPTGFVCFVPRRDVIILPISMEDAAKTVLSAGMFMPEQQEHLRAFAEQARKGGPQGSLGL